VLIASLQLDRSTVAVENSPIYFLYGKLRAVSVLYQSSIKDTSTAGEKEGDSLADFIYKCVLEC